MQQQDVCGDGQYDQAESLVIAIAEHLYLTTLAAILITAEGLLSGTPIVPGSEFRSRHRSGGRLAACKEPDYLTRQSVLSRNPGTALRVVFAQH